MISQSRIIPTANTSIIPNKDAFKEGDPDDEGGGNIDGGLVGAGFSLQEGPACGHPVGDKACGLEKGHDGIHYYGFMAESGGDVPERVDGRPEEVDWNDKESAAAKRQDAARMAAEATYATEPVEIPM